MTPDAPPVDPGLAALLAGLRPDRGAVHALLARRIRPATVDAIAAADHGMRADEHRDALDDLLTRADPPRRLEWVPYEVLSLSLGGGLGDEVDLVIGSLLLAASTPAGSPLTALEPFLTAALRVGPAGRDAARAFLAGCRLTRPGDWAHSAGDLPYLTYAVLLLSVLAEPAPPDAVPRGLATALLDDLDRATAAGLIEPTLIGLGRKKPNRVWRDPARRVLIDGPLAGTDVGGRLAVLGQVICRDTVLSMEDLRAVFADPPTADA